ncbi:hypothetical protein, partial [Streptococcus pneumoniae]|uniref:hypothetical protein n=1 Tax=Streptococcus pneumoniae TaxID=1313 RepID=UPI000CC7C73B
GADLEDNRQQIGRDINRIRESDALCETRRADHSPWRKDASKFHTSNRAEEGSQAHLQVVFHE